MNNSLSSEGIKFLKKLQQKKNRQEFQRVVVEGFRTIEQISKSGIWFEDIFITGNCQFSLENIKTKRIFNLPHWQIEKIASTKTPQNICGLINTKTVPVLENKFLLYLDKISDPGNLGAIIRSAAAAGTSGIILSPECCEIFNPKVIRASSGLVFSFPIEVHDHDWLKVQDSQIIVTTANGLTDLFSLKIPKQNIILVIGSEAFGVSQEILNFADQTIRIPISKQVESLNAAVAAGICIFFLSSKIDQK
ncbi:MAG: RNA methyltransferase [Candidatus Cloacimonetes bacterium]|nr:RNA methyltransferase [Candidatus Cloacimonadota bacterium]